MAVTQTPRFTLPQWSAGTDSYPGRTGFNDILGLIEDQAAIAYPSGLIANRPASGAFGRFFLATDQGTSGRLYYDGGSGWIELNTNGGGGIPTAVTVGGTAVATDEGSSNRSARADHIHRLPLATTLIHGAMSSQHYALLNASTASVVNNAILRRTSSGNVFLPTSGWGASDAVPKQYVDDKTADLDAATAGITGNTIVKRWSSGHISGPDPDKPEFYATKRYVDGKTWDGSRIVSRVPFEHVDGSTHAYNTAWGGSGSIRTVHVTSGGEFCFYSSTERHKTNIEAWDINPRDALAVEPVEFDRLDPDTGEPTGVHDYGVRAEQAGQHLPMFLEHEEDGSVGGWSYLRWTTAHQVLHRWHAQRADDQQEEIDALHRTVTQQAGTIAELQHAVDALTEAVAKLTA